MLATLVHQPAIDELVNNLGDLVRRFRTFKVSLHTPLDSRHKPIINEVEFNGESVDVPVFQLNYYDVYPVEMKVPHIGGERSVWGWQLETIETWPGNRENPPEYEPVDLGKFRTPGELIVAVIRLGLETEIENIGEEMWAEQIQHEKDMGWI